MKPVNALIILIFLSLNLIVHAFSIEKPELELKLEKMQLLSSEDLRDSILYFYDKLKYENNEQYKIELADKAFEITKRKDEIAHIRSLIFRANLMPHLTEYYLNLAWKLAVKHKRIHEMNAVEYSRSLYFIDHKQYDSAMIHILKYRELSKNMDDGEGSRNILNLLGDVYYHCGLYDQAIDVYSEILQYYENEKEWNYFRPYVMMNNLGQIALKTNDIPQAHQWFERSLSLAQNELNANYRNNTIAYIYIKLAETELAGKQTSKADSLLNIVKEFPQESIFTDVHEEFLFVKLQVLMAQKNWTKSLEYALNLIPEDSNKHKQNPYVSDIYHYLSIIHKNLGNNDLSLQYLNKYVDNQELINEAEHSARSMVLLADKNQAITRLSLNQARLHNLYLIVGLGLLLFFIVVLIVFYVRLYNSKLHLVKKAMDSQSILKPVAMEEVGYDENVDEKELDELIAKMTALMQNEKVYLQSELSIAELSKMLNTNRTYLSKALNSRLKTSFPNYINHLRIQEAISLIHSGYTVSHTQEALSEKCGFSSRSAFIRSFKKYTGVVPSFFIANYNKLN